MLSRFPDSAKGTFRGYNLVYTRPDMYERRRFSAGLTPKGAKLYSELQKIMECEDISPEECKTGCPGGDEE